MEHSKVTPREYIEGSGAGHGRGRADAAVLRPGPFGAGAAQAAGETGRSRTRFRAAPGGPVAAPRGALRLGGDRPPGGGASRLGRRRVLGGYPRRAPVGLARAAPRERPAARPGSARPHGSAPRGDAPLPLPQELAAPSPRRRQRAARRPTPRLPP